MANRAETYRDAAKEHTAVLVPLHEEGRYVHTHYLAGLAVECILLAHKFLQDDRFDPKHDLRRLAKQSRFLQFVPEGRRDLVRASLNEVTLRWDNAHRYRPKSSLRAFLAAACLDRRVRGDRLHFSSEQMVRSAILVVEEGLKRWKT